MKLIIAYIQPDRLPMVKNALAQQGVGRLSVTNALGCGAQQGYTERYRGAEQTINLLKKVRVEIAVNDEFEQPAIDAVVKGAQTGKIGDGKIFVLDLPRVIRIRTLEEGTEAIG
ncbi:MAG: P-II family nitrogen regulator [Myxococcota bacterium]|nr:P-II family nitrogen regulator [Myxococcota bacterium]